MPTLNEPSFAATVITEVVLTVFATATCAPASVAPERPRTFEKPLTGGFAAISTGFTAGGARSTVIAIDAEATAPSAAGADAAIVHDPSGTLVELYGACDGALRILTL